METARTSIIIIVTGVDRPGIVDLLSGKIAAHNANWEESRMVRLAGRWAGILRVSVNSDKGDALVGDLKSLASSELSIQVEPYQDKAQAEQYRSLHLELIGADHEGIVKDVSRALAERAINIEELSTETFSAPMAGITMFRATVALQCPSTLTLDDLRGVLEPLADDLMVDVNLEESTTE